MLKILDRIPLFQLRRLHPADPSPDDVREAWRVTCARYGTTPVVQWTAEDIATVRKALAAMGVDVPPDFMQKFVVTSGTRIYVPFAIGVPGAIWTLRQQVEVEVAQIASARA